MKPAEPIRTRLGGIRERRTTDILPPNEDHRRTPPRRLDDLARARLRDTPPKRTVFAVRAGDYMQAGYDLRMALQIAEVAIGEAERAGSPAETVNKLRAMIKQLRAA